MPRPLDERAAADLFFAELTGQPLPRWLPRRRGRAGGAWRTGGSPAAPTGESMPFAEDVVRSSVKNPGWSSWGVMVGSVPSKQDPPPRAGAIRQRSDESSDYTGWERKSEPFTLEQQKAGIGFVLDITTAAKVKGQRKGTTDAVYVTDVTVTASVPRDVSPTRRMVGVVDVHVGFEDKNRKLHFVKASWDRDKGCARVDIPVRVSFSSPRLLPDQFVITWFGNGEVERSPLATP